MELRQIRYAEAVARYGNFSRAAESLYITQQTLSQQVRKLEDELGFALFERSTRSVLLTPKGELFIAKALPVLQAFDHFTSEVDALKDGGASLRIGILPTFSHLNILDAIHEFQLRQPETNISLQIQTSLLLLERLSGGRLDAVIANLSKEDMTAYEESCAVHILSRDRICAVLNDANRHADKPRLTLSELDGEPVLLLSKGSSIRKRMEAALREVGVTPSAVFDCPEIHSMIGMLHADMGVGFLSSQITKQYVRPPLKSIEIVPPPETATALLYAKRNPQRELLNEFSAFIQESLNTGN